MLKSITEFFMTGFYMIILYVFYSAVVFSLTFILGLPIAVAIYYITEIMKYYIL